MNDHQDHNHEHNGWASSGVAVAEEHATPGDTSGDEAHDATRPAEADGVPARAARNARSSRTRRRATGRVSGDLTSLLHKHVTAMGPTEAVHAIDTLRHLTSMPSANDGRVDAEWLTQLGDSLAALRDGPAIKRLVSMLVDLVPVVHASDNEAAVNAVIEFARQSATAAQEAAADRQRRRR